jgi:hypothetical protein
MSSPSVFADWPVSEHDLSVGFGEERVHVYSRLGVVLEEEAVGGVGVDRELRIRQKPGQQI